MMMKTSAPAKSNPTRGLSSVNRASRSSSTGYTAHGHVASPREEASGFGDTPWEIQPVDFTGVPLHAEESECDGSLWPCCQQAGPLQAKMTISQPTDPYERQADQVADSVANGTELPRLSRATSTKASPPRGELPPAAVRAFGSTSHPLDESARGFMESRFGCDFTGVRVHTDKISVQASSSLRAMAYTVGEEVFFGLNQYQPSTPAGRRLLAHELTHVVQQRATNSAPLVQRRSIFETIGIFLGITEGSFSEGELHAYLDGVTKSNRIEDKFDSDNKARAIVRHWRAGAPGFNLTGTQKALLVTEMDTGYVGGEDQQGVLDLLVNSDSSDLRVIFTTGGVKAQTLDSDFSGGRLKELRAFFEARFKGGKAALLKGDVNPQAGPGPVAPHFAYDWLILKAKLEAGAPVAEINTHLASLSPPERERALKDLTDMRIASARQLDQLREDLAKAPPAAKTSLKEKGGRLSATVSTVDVVIQALAKDIAIAETKASLTSKTAVPTVAQKAEIAKALKPDVRTDVAGHALPFKDTLPGETTNYEGKLRAYLPTMIDQYYDSMVADKGPVEHADPSKTHSLKELENIGNVSAKETDKVFGTYKTGPPLKADTTTKRGNIHDLWADTQAELAGLSKPQRRRKAQDLMFYFFQSDDGVLDINHAHNAQPSFTPDNKASNPEAKTLATLADDFTKTDADVKRLNEIDRGWDASAQAGQINIQIFKRPVVDQDRDFLWDMFQTLIHEYLHTLADGKYNTFAESFGGRSNENNTLIEGVDSFLDEVVWQNIQPRVNELGPTGLRTLVEGPGYAALPPIKVLPPSRRRYLSYTQAVKLVGVVGVRNLYAAYFLGQVDKLGG